MFASSYWNIFNIEIFFDIHSRFNYPRLFVNILTSLSCRLKSQPGQPKSFYLSKINNLNFTHCNIHWDLLEKTMKMDDSPQYVSISQEIQLAVGRPYFSNIDLGLQWDIKDSKALFHITINFLCCPWSSSLQCELAGEPHKLFHHCCSWDSEGFSGLKCYAKLQDGDSTVSNQNPLLSIWDIVPSWESYKNLKRSTFTSSSVLEVSFDKKANISWRLNLDHLALSCQLLLKT